MAKIEKLDYSQMLQATDRLGLDTNELCRAHTSVVVNALIDKVELLEKEIETMKQMRGEEI